MPTNYEMQFEGCCEAFAASYEVSNLPAMREVERTVLGCDYGGTSWTTSTQATQIVEMLGLRQGLKFLDIGAGSGWPGLFLADTSGCDVTLLDLPVGVLAKAIKRSRSDGIDDRVDAIAASGSAMPIRNACFDVISHSDGLCCTPEKIEMLRECRRIATDRAKMLFSVIAVTQNLSEADHRRAVDAGPPFVDAPNCYADILEACGWRLVEHIDATSEHRRSLSALVKAFENSAELSDVLGDDVVSQARKRRQEQIAVIDAGLLVREIFIAIANDNEASQILPVDL